MDFRDRSAREKRPILSAGRATQNVTQHSQRSQLLLLGRNKPKPRPSQLGREPLMGSLSVCLFGRWFAWLGLLA